MEEQLGAGPNSSCISFCQQKLRLTPFPGHHFEEEPLLLAHKIRHLDISPSVGLGDTDNLEKISKTPKNYQTFKISQKNLELDAFLAFILFSMKGPVNGTLWFVTGLICKRASARSWLAAEKTMLKIISQVATLCTLKNFF